MKDIFALATTDVNGNLVPIKSYRTGSRKYNSVGAAKGARTMLARPDLVIVQYQAIGVIDENTN